MDKVLLARLPDRVRAIIFHFILPSVFVKIQRWCRESSESDLQWRGFFTLDNGGRLPELVDEVEPQAEEILYLDFSLQNRWWEEVD